MAQFKTGRFQETIHPIVAVVGTVNDGTEVTSVNRKDAICVGDFVKYMPASGSNPAYIEKAAAADLESKTATHIVAMTDQTIADRKVNTAVGDYRYSPLVGATIGSTSVSSSTPVKRVGLYPILDWDDVVPAADAMDVKA